MDLVTVYVKNVGMHLPEKNREDIEREIRSTIEDTLEDESQAQGRAPDEAMIVDVLRRMGPPQKVAASYLPPRYLIGPQLYPYFVTTLRIVLPLILVLAAIGLGASLGESVKAPGGWGEAVGQTFAELFNSLFYALGFIVTIFAVIQYLNPNLKLGEKTWDPRKLRIEPDPERVKMSGPIAEIIFSVLAIVAFAMYPEWIGFFAFRNGQWIHASVLTPVFFQYLPWLVGLWACEIGRDALLLAQGRYTPLTRWVSVILSLWTIVLAALMLAGPSIVALDPAAIGRLGWGTPDSEVIRRASEAFVAGIRVVIGIILALEVVELGKQLYKAALRGKVQPVTL